MKANGAMNCDAVVIGSGVAGMSAALMLADHGRRVILVEKHEHTAPLLRRFQRDGLYYEPGLHYLGGLGPTGSLSVMFRYLGIEDHIQTRPMNQQGYDIVNVDGAAPVRLPVGFANLREELVRRYPNSRAAVIAYVDRVESIHTHTPFLSFDLPDDALDTKGFDSPESLASFLMRHGAEPALREMLSRYGMFLYGMDAGECPITLHAMVQGSFYRSAHTLVDGGDGLIGAFERRLSELGVEVLVGREVVRLETDDRRSLRGVLLMDDQLIECRDCVCTVHPQLLLGLFAKGSVRPAFLNRLRDQDNTPGVIGVFLEVDEPPVDLRSSNVYFVGSSCGATLSDGELAVMNCASGGDSGGRKGLCLLRPCSFSWSSPRFRGGEGHTETYSALKREEADRTVEIFLQQFPGQRGKCRVREVATPGTYERYTSTVGGSAYGIKHSVDRTGLASITPIRGLHLAGQSVMAPGVFGVLISSLLAVSRVLGQQTVWNEVRQCR